MDLRDAELAPQMIFGGSMHSTRSAVGAVVCVEDGNAIDVPVSTTSSQPIPSEIADLRIGQVASTHVRLSWPAVAAATGYRIYHSTSPDPATFRVLADTTSTAFDDVGEAANANTYYYLVRPRNACGQEGP